MRDWEEDWIANIILLMDHIKQRYPDRYRFLINVDEGIKPTVLNMEEDGLIHGFFTINDGWGSILKKMNELHNNYLLHYTQSTMVENFLLKKVQLQRIRNGVEQEALEEYLESLIDANFLELVMGLNEAKKKRQFGNLLIEYIVGLKAIIGLAAKLLYQKGVYKKKNIQYLKTIFNAINQMELIGTYFNQKVLMMFSLYLRSLIFHSIGDRKNAEGTFLAADQMKQWFQKNNKEIDIISIFDTIGFFYLSLIEEFQVENAEKDFIFTLETLLNIPVEELIWLKEPFFGAETLPSNKLKHAISITTNMLTIYSRSNLKGGNPELPILLGNFVTALMTLVNEFGDKEILERIYFKKGAIYVYPLDQFTFILFTTHKEFRDKVALKEFATYTKEIFKEANIETYNSIPLEVMNQIDELAKKYFGF